MIERALRAIAVVLSLIVVAGFAMFALDEFDRVSSKQRSELAGFERSDPTPVGERQRERRHSTGREYIDDANDILLKPFAGVVSSGSRWTQRGAPTLLALLACFALGFLARFAKGRG